jgi:hypothetical protein
MFTCVLVAFGIVLFPVLVGGEIALPESVIWQILPSKDSGQI